MPVIQFARRIIARQLSKGGSSQRSVQFWRRNGGFKRGIRVANISDLRIFAFIPDPEPDQDNSGTSAAEGVAVDNEGNVYGAEVGPRALRKHVKR